MKGVMNTQVMVQVGFIVKDIEKTKRKFAQLFGVPVPETVNGTEGPEKFHVTQSTYKGKQNPEINAKLAFLEVGGAMAIELIEPNEVSSLWRDWLNEHGEGIQHIAFVVDSIDKTIPHCEAFGMKVLQTGNFAAGDGRYAYMDATKDLKTIIELLERW
jgi:catechol 2,3-dioxygenase-like lactoylglutathione lyase family enzyme